MVFRLHAANKISLVSAETFVVSKRWQTVSNQPAGGCPEDVAGCLSLRDLLMEGAEWEDLYTVGVVVDTKAELARLEILELIVRLSET